MCASQGLGLNTYLLPPLLCSVSITPELAPAVGDAVVNALARAVNPQDPGSVSVCVCVRASVCVCVCVHVGDAVVNALARLIRKTLAVCGGGGANPMPVRHLTLYPNPLITLTLTPSGNPPARRPQDTGAGHTRWVASRSPGLEGHLPTQNGQLLRRAACPWCATLTLP